MRVLEIGCGTSTLTMLMAERGASVTGVDASPAMLGEAQKKILAGKFAGQATLKHMAAAIIGDCFAPASFDLIVSTLVFSELSIDEQRYVLVACSKLLAPGGRLLIADEVIPTGSLARLIYYLVRLPLALFTWLITRTTTRALREFESLLAQSGFLPGIGASYLGNNLVLYTATLIGETHPGNELPPTVVGHLRHRVTVRTILIDLWALFFRIISLYPKVKPGLYAVGNPTPDQIRRPWSLVTST
jgi:SAM-dependent methyltransferase